MFFLAACGGDAWVAPSGAAGRQARAQALDAPEPMGTFEATGPAPGQLLRVVLMADRTSHLEGSPVCDPGEIGCELPQLDSFYKRWEAEGVKHLYFVAEDGQILRAYDYRYDGVTLEVFDQWSVEWQALPRAKIAWCSTAPQCEQQWLYTPLCPGSWACIDNGCQYSCHG